MEYTLLFSFVLTLYKSLLTLYFTISTSSGMLMDLVCLHIYEI